MKAPTHVGRLLSEISWEGNAKGYHYGGRGRENVLTVEVFQALDFLPRPEFLGRVLKSVTGGAAETVQLLVNEIEDATVSLLPGDIFLATEKTFTVQPDAEIVSPSIYCLIEAKRIKGGGAFQPQQMAREYLAVLQEAQRRCRKPLLLLVFSEDPPIPVRGNGKVEIEPAVAKYLDVVRARCEHDFAEPDRLHTGIGDVIAATTWAGIEARINDGINQFSIPDSSVSRAIHRVATNALTALNWHAGKGGSQ